MRQKEILHKKITAYHLNFNRLVKRANRDIKNYLQKFTEKRMN